MLPLACFGATVHCSKRLSYSHHAPTAEANLAGEAGDQKRPCLIVARRRRRPPGGPAIPRVATAPKQLGETHSMGLEEHRVGIAALRPDILVGPLRQCSPERRRGRWPVLARQEQACAARKGPGPVTTQRCRSRALDLGASQQHGIDRGGTLARAPDFARLQLFGDVAAKLNGRERPQRAGVRADPVPLLGEAPSQRRRVPIPSRVRAPEERNEVDGGTALQQLSTELERHRTAGAIAGEDARTVGLKGADLVREILRQILDARERLALAVDTGRLEPEEGVLAPQVAREGAITEDVAVMSADREYGRLGAAALQRDNGALLVSERLGRTQELQDLSLVSLQRLAQLGRKDAGRCRAAHTVALGLHVDIAAAQVSQQGGHPHSSISSRPAAPCARTFPLALHDRVSRASAKLVIVEFSNKVRVWTSTPKTSRMRASARMASNESPPRSKKSSVRPMCSTFKSSAQMAATACSVSVSGGATSWAGCARSNETGGSA